MSFIFAFPFILIFFVFKRLFAATESAHTTRRISAALYGAYLPKNFNAHKTLFFLQTYLCVRCLRYYRCVCAVNRCINKYIYAKPIHAHGDRGNERVMIFIESTGCVCNKYSSAGNKTINKLYM